MNRVKGIIICLLCFLIFHSCSNDNISNSQVNPPDISHPENYIHKIYFVDGSLFSINSDGTDLKQIINRGVVDYLISPDGSQVLFTNYSGHPMTLHLFLADSNGGNLKEIGFNTDIGCFSPDSKQLIYIENYQLYNYDILTNKKIQLTETGYNNSPTYTANGNSIVYANNEGGLPDRIIELNVENKNKREVKRFESGASLPLCLPNSYIAFLEGQAGRGYPSIIDIFGNSYKRLGGDTLVGEGQLSISKNGFIIFSAENINDSRNEIYISSSNSIKKLTDSQTDDITPHICPNADKIVWEKVDSGDHPDVNIYIMDSDGTNIKLLTKGFKPVIR